MVFTETGALPEHIKKNFFYRKLHREVYELEMNAQIIIIGKPGLGKSTIGQRICLDLDPTFNINRIVYSMEDFLRLLDEGDPDTGKLKIGQAILFDEIVTDEGAESRGAMSKSNKLMNYVNATYRAMRLIVVFCLPSLMQLDKSVREINNFAILEVVQKDTKLKQNRCKLFYCKYDPYTQKAYRQYPRLIDANGAVTKINSVMIGLPPTEFMNNYKEKKMAYLNANIKRWYAAVKQINKVKEGKRKGTRDLINLIKSNPKPCMIGGRYSSILIQAEHEIGKDVAASLAGTLNKEIRIKANAGSEVTKPLNIPAPII